LLRTLIWTYVDPRAEEVSEMRQRPSTEFGPAFQAAAANGRRIIRHKSFTTMEIRVLAAVESEEFSKREDPYQIDNFADNCAFGPNGTSRNSAADSGGKARSVSGMADL
jgi:hypothetical protein